MLAGVGEKQQVVLSPTHHHITSRASDSCDNNHGRNDVIRG
jgi:hypothetical protein